MGRKIINKFIFAVVIFIFTLPAEAKDKLMIKETNVAGTFYPQGSNDLSEMIDSYMSGLPASPYNNVIGVISPHAGYVYSAVVAAYSYNALSNADFDLAVILSPSHYSGFSGAAVYPGDGFSTPFGVVEVDKEAVAYVLDNNNLLHSAEIYFDKEHALEVQLPFLKKIKENVKILPVIIGQGGYDLAVSLADTLNSLSKIKKIVLIASTDLSHYHPYNAAKEMDMLLADHIKNNDRTAFIASLNNGSCEACGYMPLLTLMQYASLKKAELKILKYANSGDTAGDRTRVVGYLSVLAYVPDESSELSAEDKDYLLTLARNTLETYLRTGQRPEVNVSQLSDELTQVRGAFVTLHKNGQLRGCIGNYGVEPLYQTVINMSIAAAVSDTRFPQVTYDELPHIDIEISALSPLKRVTSPDEIILGKHGVIVKSGFRQGVFLPQVAAETGWSKEEFLSYLCSHKAGLPKDAWKQESTELTVFTAEVFSE